MAVQTVGVSSWMPVGGSSYAFPNANQKWAFKVVASVGGSATRGKLYAYQNFASAKCRMAIYSDSAGVPNALLGVSDEVTGLVTGWNTFAFSTPIALTAGVTYWIAALADTNVTLSSSQWYWGTAGSWNSGNYYYNANAYTSGFSATFGAGTANTSPARGVAVEWDAATADTAKVVGYAVIGPEVNAQSTAKLYGYAVIQTFTDPAPTVGSVAPNPFPAGSPTSVIIHGTGYQSGAVVYFNGTAGTVTNVTATDLTVSTPAGIAPGAVVIAVVNPDGQHATINASAYRASSGVIVCCCT